MRDRNGFSPSNYSSLQNGHRSRKQIRRRWVGFFLKASVRNKTDCGCKSIVGVDLKKNDFLRIVKISITHAHRK